MKKEGWVKKKLGDCFCYIKNGANIKQDRTATGIPITRIETLANGLFNRDRLGYANIFSSEDYSQYILETGDLLFSHINSKQYIGRTVLYTRLGNEQIIHGMNLLRLKVIPNVLFPNFVYYYFKSPFIKAQIASHRKDAVNQSSISITDLKRITLFVPPLPEQQQIVSELDCLQGIIDKKNAQLQELDKLAQSIFYTMFGDPVENEKGWEVKKLKDVAPKKEYKGDIPSYNEKYWLLNLDMVESNTGRIISKVLFDYDDIGSSTNKFNNENVLYSKLRPYLNKVVIPEDSGYSTSELIPLYPQKDILNRYFLASLLRNKSFVDFIKDKVAGAKMPRVNLDTFYKFPLILPPLPLQQEFADKITAIEQQKERIQKSLQDTETLFQSRMDYYFG